MKVYKEAGLVSNSKGENFYTNLTERISEYQDKGYIVEIQYQPIGNSFSALILAYTEE